MQKGRDGTIVVTSVDRRLTFNTINRDGVTNISVAMHEVSATEEFVKNPDLKQEDLTLLRTWLATQEHLPHIKDEMLILFHHSCYFNIEKTKDCIESYYTLRTNTPELFTKRDVSEPALAKALSALNFAILPKREPNGYEIVYHGLKDYEPSKYMYVDDVKLLLMSMDAALLSSGTSDGLVILFNMQGLKLMHLTRINLKAMRTFLQYIQEANPVRMKAMYVINVMPFIDKVMALIKPFIKKELMSLIYFHTGDMESFYECISKDRLPSDFGGELESVEQLSAKHNKRLLSLADFFAQEEKCRVDETKRQKGKKNKQKETEIAFEKLEID